jgi:hypothetical protein
MGASSARPVSATLRATGQVVSFVAPAAATAKAAPHQPATGLGGGPPALEAVAGCCQRHDLAACTRASHACTLARHLLTFACLVRIFGR